jgi:hypothetical protein
MVVICLSKATGGSTLRARRHPHSPSFSAPLACRGRSSCRSCLGRPKDRLLRPVAKLLDIVRLNVLELSEDDAGLRPVAVRGVGDFRRVNVFRELVMVEALSLGHGLGGSRRYHGERDAGITGFSHIGSAPPTPPATRPSGPRSATRESATASAMRHCCASTRSITRSRCFRRAGQASTHQPSGRHRRRRDAFVLFPIRAAGADGVRTWTASDLVGAVPLFRGSGWNVFKYSSGVREIADELLCRERQFPFDPKGFCQCDAKPQIKEFRS